MSAIGSDDIFLAVDHGLAGLDDAPLVGEILLRGFRRESSRSVLSIRLADEA